MITMRRLVGPLTMRPERRGRIVVPVWMEPGQAAPANSVEPRPLPGGSGFLIYRLVHIRTHVGYDTQRFS